MKPYDTFDAIDSFTASARAFECLTSTLAAPQAAALAHHELEELVETKGRELLRLLLQDHFDLRAAREREQIQERLLAGNTEVVRGVDGLVRPHRESGHSRKLACLFGTVTVTRTAWRQKGLVNVHPADVELSLPAGRHSFGLRRLAVLEAVRGSYDQATAAIEDRCGKVLGKRQAELLVVAAAVDVDDFYRCTIPLPSTATTALVMQVDGKGVVMRPEALRPATLKAHLNSRHALRTRLAPGEKPHRKRMATLACVFDADPAPRRPHDVIAPPEGRSTLARTPRSGPRAHRKWLTASLVQTPEQVIAAAFDQAAARDRDHLRDWVVLVDGARHQLGLIQTEAGRRGIKVHIMLDFVHVSEYIWDAAHCFNKPGTPAAEAWVAGHLTTILHGQAARAATEITTQADRTGLHGTRREGADACVRYLTGHLGQLRYDTALAAGWPIATGAIEGACRHIVGDRLDITGSRWGLKGAEAVLKLRTLNDNGDFNTYWAFHLAREHKRIYPTPDQHTYSLTA
ncbi:ISKra4 family transposase [Streptomyces sp. NPDC051572]|uniref:ISKra4 family transposase n=1 Tax=Streptomyces sp. NPDC051572 TaxID=3155802 RepID=UPI00344BFC84